MKTFTSISLVILLALNLFGFYLAFVIKQSDIHQEVLESIGRENREKSEVLSFSSREFSQITWLRAGKEFQLNGHLYDVVSIETNLNGVTLYVEDDTQEASLIRDFISNTNSQSEKDPFNSPLKIMLEHFLKDFTAQGLSILLKPATTLLCFNPIADASLTSCIIEHQSPPPKSA